MRQRWHWSCCRAKRRGCTVLCESRGMPRRYGLARCATNTVDAAGAIPNSVLQAIALRDRENRKVKKVILVIAVAVGLYVSAAYVRGWYWGNRAMEYSKESLIAIAQPWNADEIIRRGSQSMKATPRSKIEETVTAARTVLGNLSTMKQAPDCHLFRGLDSYSGKTNTYASCVVSATFDRKIEQVEIVIVIEGDDWRLNDFHVK